MPQLGIALGAFLLLLGTLEAANILRTQAPIFGSHQVHQGGPGIDAVAAGQWLKTNADPRATVAVIGAGAIPYFSGLTALDYLGIVNPTVAHMPFHPVMLDLGDGTKQQDFVRLDVNWLLNQAPTYIEIMGSIRKDGSLATDTTIAQLVFESKRFQEEYGNEPVFVSGKEMLFEHR